MKRMSQKELDERGCKWDGYDEGYTFTDAHGLGAEIRRSLSCVQIARTRVRRNLSCVQIARTRDGVACLDRDNIVELISILQRFVDTGTFENDQKGIQDEQC